tara:strand:+ start:370 stop:702 length:333 start_codon:yes stop_codon:yes gene_type:complete
MSRDILIKGQTALYNGDTWEQLAEGGMSPRMIQATLSEQGFYDEVKKSVLVRVYKDEYIDLQEVADMNDKFIKEITDKDLKKFAIDNVSIDFSGMKGGFSAQILEEKEDE